MFAGYLALKDIQREPPNKKDGRFKSEVRRDNAFSSPGMLPLLAKHSLFSFSGPRFLQFT